jgi:archaeal flagellar protein FlaJ
MIRIPYCFLPEPILNKLYSLFLPIGDILDNNIFPNFSLSLKQARVDINSKRYLTFSVISNLFVSVLVFVMAFMGASRMESRDINPLLIGIFFSILVFFFIFMQQVSYPKIITKKRVDNIERNILPALQNILVQLRSGIPLFDVAVNIASSDYGGVSDEFMKLVKQINGGMHQVEAFEKMALDNPSPLFRSWIWQMVNGMKTGSELSDVLKDTMDNLAEEELLQIEQYGAVLSPLTMFYMIGAVILPALGVNFLIVISAFMDLGVKTTQLVFWGVYGFILFFQFMFLTIINSRRPSLLEK